MELLPEIQEGVLCLLCYDDKTAKLAEELVPVPVFDPFYREIAEAACRHRAKHGKVPGEHTFDLIQTLSARAPDSASNYEAILASIEELKTAVQPNYVLDRARYFARWQKLRTAAGEMLSALDARTDKGVDQAENVLLEATKVSAHLFDGGLKMSSVDELVAIINRVDGGIISTGIPELDNLRCAPARGRLHTCLASTGRGKSWYLVHLAKQAARRGARVLYVTLEMDELEVAQRLYQAFFSVSESEAVKGLRKIIKSQDGQYESLTEFTFEDGARPTLKDPRAEDELRENITRGVRIAAKVRVKHFPQNNLTVASLEAWLDSVSLYEGFVPDLILIDYADLFVKNPNDIRGSTRLIYEGLKGLAQTRNVAVATVSQSNRGGVKARVIDEENVAEDFSKMMTSDHVVTYNQTDEEASLGFARLYVAKNRCGKSRVLIAITQSYDIGQFCVSSAVYDSRMGEDILEAEGRKARGTEARMGGQDSIEELIL